MQPKSLKGFSVFIDGYGYLGLLVSGQLPKLTIKTEEHRDGGMDAPIEQDMGMEALASELVFSEFNRRLFQTFGNSNVPITLRGSQEDEDGAKEAIEGMMRGLVKEIDPGDWKPGEKGECKLAISPRYYRLRIGGEDTVEIDVINGVRKIGGVDQLAARRANLGL